MGLLEDTHKRLAFSQQFIKLVQHPLPSFEPEEGGDAFIIQPADSHEISAAEYIGNLSSADRKALSALLTIWGKQTLESNSICLLAIGSKTFTPLFWDGIKEAAELREKAELSSEGLVPASEEETSQDFRALLKSRGEDQDFVLLAGNDKARSSLQQLGPNGLPFWVNDLAEKLDKAGIEYKVKATFANGKQVMRFLAEVTVERSAEAGTEEGSAPILKRTARIDERPHRHAVAVKGMSILIRFPDASPIHIRSNLAEDAETVIKLEQLIGASFAPVLRPGRSIAYSPTLRPSHSRYLQF